MMATRTIRWGILGTGAVAVAFAEGLRSLPGARLEAVASRSRDRAEAFARVHGAARAHASYEALAGDPAVDVVYVATPSPSHRDHAVLALEHGKAALVEKPFALTGSDARAIAEAARRTKRFCMEAMWMRFVPLVRELVPLVRGGAIGDLRMAVASLGFAFPFDPDHRAFDPALGGGALLDLGVYALSFLFQFFGPPTEVAAQATVGATGVDEQAAALLRFPAGRQAVITTSIRGHLTNDAVLFGTEGQVRVHEPLYVPEAATVVRTPLQARGHASAGGGGGGGGSGATAAPLRSELAAVRASLRERPLLRDLYARLKRVRRERTLVRRRLGNGYAHEALEVMRALEEGREESPILPLDESVAIIETMDRIRAGWDRRDHGQGE